MFQFFNSKQNTKKEGIITLVIRYGVKTQSFHISLLYSFVIIHFICLRKLLFICLRKLQKCELCFRKVHTLVKKPFSLSFKKYFAMLCHNCLYIEEENLKKDEG